MHFRHGVIRKKLKEYAQFIARVRIYLEPGNDVEDAIDKATDECINEGILRQICLQSARQLPDV